MNALERTLLAVTLFPSTVQAQSTIHVPAEFLTIQAAITAASSSDTVLVAPGTYVEAINFQGKDITVVSSGGAMVTTIDAAQMATVVTFVNSEGPGARLEGFTITGGLGAPFQGGGIHCDQTNPTIVDCVVVANTGGPSTDVAQGLGGAGGLHCFRSSPTVLGCTIESNTGGVGGTATSITAGAGGIFCYVASPTIEDCTIRLNVGGDVGDGPSGVAGAGGILCMIQSSPAISNCLLEENQGGSAGLDAYGDGGAGGIYCRAGSSPIISGCIIRNNSGGTDGPGLGHAGTGGVNCTSGSHPLIVNSVIAFNDGGDAGMEVDDHAGGGGVYVEATGPMHAPVIVNCSIVGNTSGTGDYGAAGGIHSESSTKTKIRNSIVWGNTGTGGFNQIDNDSGQAPNAKYCNVEGGYAGEGNIDADPLFADAAAGDYHLLCGSPCVDAGQDMFGQVEVPDTDFEGDARPLGAAVDMGADELVPAVTVGASYCASTPNSTGGAALIRGEGCPSVSANALTLLATPVPDTPGIFFYGATAIQVPFGNGFRCVGGATTRGPFVVGAAGETSWTLDVSQPPHDQVTAGSTWNFQAWFRDPMGGGSLFDLSDGLIVLFEP